jgi:hypothetical protein
MSSHWKRRAAVSVRPGWVRTLLVEKQMADIAARKKIIQEEGANEFSAAFVTSEKLGATINFLCLDAAMKGNDMFMPDGESTSAMNECPHDKRSAATKRVEFKPERSSERDRTPVSRRAGTLLTTLLPPTS